MNLENRNPRSYGKLSSRRRGFPRQLKEVAKLFLTGLNKLKVIECFVDLVLKKVKVGVIKVIHNYKKGN